MCDAGATCAANGRCKYWDTCEVRDETCEAAIARMIDEGRIEYREAWFAYLEGFEKDPYLTESGVIDYQ